jgi:hypothetical protein
MLDTSMQLNDRLNICIALVRKWDIIIRDKIADGLGYKQYHLYYSNYLCAVANKILTDDNKCLTYTLGNWCAYYSFYETISFNIKQLR